MLKRFAVTLGVLVCTASLSACSNQETSQAVSSPPSESAISGFSEHKSQEIRQEVQKSVERAQKDKLKRDERLQKLQEKASELQKKQIDQSKKQMNEKVKPIKEKNASRKGESDGE